ncbi:MAG: hypothetical protein K2X27_17165, partial [Candidatus Obscuribacterales bacterium]|nr:hypothetical protein [Candidatus Obscuribacterales bacterium]
MPPETDDDTKKKEQDKVDPADDRWAEVSRQVSSTETKAAETKPASSESDSSKPASKESSSSESKEAKGDIAKAGESKSSDSAFERLPKLEGLELKRAQFLQVTLSNMAPLFKEIKMSEAESKLPPDAKHEMARKQISDMRDALSKEREAGVFGPATEAAYKEYTNWLQKAVPETIRELDSLHLALPPGSPIKLDSDAQGRALNPQLYKAMMADERLSLDLKIDPGKVPSNEQLEKLDSIYKFMAESNQSVAEARGKQRDAIIEKLINENGLPEAWKKKEGEDPLSWRNSAEEMIDLSLRTRNYVEAMQSLYKSSRSSDFPMELPVGAKIKVESSNGTVHEIKASEINDPYNKQILKDGKIKEVIPDLPKDLRQMEPANQQKIAQLRDWLDKHGDKINQAIGQLQDLDKNPDAVIMFGDQEVKNGKALIDSAGNFVRLVSGKYSPKDGETVKDMNLIGYDFQVEQIKDGPNAGKYKVTQTIVPENAPWYAYENIRAFGIEKVGEKMKVDEKILGADDFVPVKSGDKIELVKAKNLDSFKATQQFAYYGEKALTITMDVAMTATGVAEGVAVLRGARLATMGVEAAAKLGYSQAQMQAYKLGTREVLVEGGKALTRTVVGGSGFFLNSAGARSTELGQTLNTARGIYFLGDIGLGLAGTTWNAFRAGKAVESLSAADKVHHLIRGREAVNGEEALRSMAWINTGHKISEFGFKATELGFAPVIISDLNHQISAIRDAGKRDPLRDAMIQVGDGRGLQKAEKGSFDPKNAKALEAAHATIDRFQDTLSRGRKPEVAAEIKEIFARSKELMGPNASEADKAKFRQEMMSKLVFTPEQIKEIELAHPAALSEEKVSVDANDLKNLLDPEKRKDYPKAMVALAEKFMAEKNKDVLVAAQIAMLYTARNSDGKIDGNLASASFEVPEYKKTISKEDDDGRREEEEVTVGKHSFDQGLTSAELIANLRRDLADPAIGNRGIVSGEVMTRIGALSHQEFGGVLQNVLRDPNAGREDKLAALSDADGPRMATIIDGVRMQDQGRKEDDTSKARLDRAKGVAHGLDYEAMLSQLDKTAREDKDPDVRTMSAALAFGLREKAKLEELCNSPDEKTRQLARTILDGSPDKPGSGRKDMLAALNTMLEKSKANPGEFAANAKAFLKKEMQSAIPEEPAVLADLVRNSRYNAANALSLISSDAAEQKAINHALATSFSPTNVALSDKIIRSLMPDRMAQLEKDEPRLANDLRLGAIALIKKPSNPAEERDVVGLLQQLEPLLRNGDQETKRQLQGKLNDLIRNSELNHNYARDNHELRAAAIDSLAALGSRESLDLIRSHATAEAFLEIKGNPISAGENTAAVRLAAVRALEKLGDPKLREVVTALIDKETDPTVASQLRDVAFTQQRIEPDSREWKEMYERTRTDIIGFGKKYPYLDNFTQAEAEKWMRENFDLLDYGTFKDRAKSAVDNATGWWFRRSSFEATINNEEFKAFAKVSDQRFEQFKQLAELAKQGGDQGNKAKMALYYMATQHGSIAGASSGLEAGAIQGYYNPNHYHKIYQQDYKEHAARALKELAASNCEGKDVVAKIIKDGLTQNIEVENYVNNDLLDAWRSLGKPDKNGYAIPREELARVSAEALSLETRRRPGSQSDYLQKGLIEDLQKYGHRMVLPVLQAIVDEAKVPNSARTIAPEVRDKAQATIDNFLHSTKLMWDETKADQNASPQERANQIKKALEDKNNAETTVQAIFNAYKGYRIKDGNDPGLNQLQLALNDTNERVRMAAARVLMNSELPNSNTAKSRALATLADLTLGGSNASYHNEAFELLKSAGIDTPLYPNVKNRFYMIEKEGDSIRAVELTKIPGISEPVETGRIYPNGTSFRHEKNSDGQITQIWENGANWQRKFDGSKATNEWINSSTKASWSGEYKVLPKGEYRYQTAGKPEVLTRNANGVIQSRAPEANDFAEDPKPVPKAAPPKSEPLEAPKPAAQPPKELPQISVADDGKKETAPKKPELNRSSFTVDDDRALGAGDQPPAVPKPVEPGKAVEAPKVEVEEAPKAAEVNLEGKLEGEALKRSQYVQDTLKNLVPLFMERKQSEEDAKLKPEELQAKVRSQIASMKEAIQKERDAGVFGPATQEAYKQYTNWLQKAVPETIREMDSLQLALPPGSPIPLDSDRQGRAIDPRLYKALAADERLTLDLKLEAGKLPSDAQLDKLDAVYNWLSKANESVSEARGKQRDSMIEKLITDNGLPEGWKKQAGDDPLSWRNSAEEMVDLSVRTRNYIEAMQSLFKASRNDDFPLELPRGTSIKVADESGKEHTISD